MLKMLVTMGLLFSTLPCVAQARATASRLGDAQVGVTFTNANSDYARSRFNGYGIYADFDFHKGIGAEASYNFISDGDPNTNVYERTYEIGARYSRHYGRYQPYGKVAIGRGVLNYPYNSANLAYNMGALGVGVDIRVLRHMNGRIGYEYQRWSGFSKSGTSAANDSLTPTSLSAGFAYHF
ncbi:porin family protein [Granulicella arctica]|uniref:porin family protein n=1 Tax=Granulicella arctica TaxID=940613 RepID=UPI0021E0C22C|nr:porin family protein [Granulicella arctica]